MAGWRVLIGWTLMVACLTAGAAGAGTTSRRQPPPPPPTKGPVAYLKSLLPWTEVEPAEEFVRESRPAEAGPFIAIGTEPRDQELRIKTPAELAAMKAGLEQARTVHDNLRAHPPALTTAAAPAAAPSASATAKTEAAKTEPTKRRSKRSARHKPAAAAPVAN